ncbi:UNVERIFIED_CONTAM: putative serine/threonine-protein kinase [Sesamum calycinum]|uniref:Serine/threonine-protein kinase n=1 Tax=Sesamum calycinum TaxID=2727403 RepID=A0AAW2JE17_9LAMI
MGCVLGKRAAGKREARRKQKNDERRGSESATATVQDGGVVGRGEEKKIEEAPVAAVATAPAPAPAAAAVARPEFRLKRGVSAGGEGWPSWLNDVAGHAIKDWKPRRANTFEKLEKIGQGTYSNVYKARDLITGKVVALKKVRFDNLEPETVRFMAREILVLRRLDHPNVIKLEGLEHCHNNGVLHRDIKCSNLLIDSGGILRIADFGLASFFDPERRRPMTSRVITLWYRPPELLLGATYYGVGVDLWSAGCILAELLAGKPILRGRTEVEQLHKIFKLCGSPTEEYWKKSRLPNATLYKPQQPYKRCLAETFKDFPPSALALIETLLAIDPDARGTATAALNSEFFTTEPYACEPSSLPKFPPSKEMDIKLRGEEARRQRGLGAKPHAIDGNRRVRTRDKFSRAVPAPEANAELQTNLDRLRIMSDAKAKSKSDKFPPPHQDAAVGPPSRCISKWPHVVRCSRYFILLINLRPKGFTVPSNHHPKNGTSRRKNSKDEPQRAPTWSFINAFHPSSVGWDFRFGRRRTISENFSERR